jgi:hypothetical protein
MFFWGGEVPEDREQKKFKGPVVFQKKQILGARVRARTIAHTHTHALALALAAHTETKF